MTRSERSYRVVQWSSGGVGALAIAAIGGRPDLELVGVWVHAPDKIGRDAGDLAGIDAVGVRTTSDADEVLALAPDCICYTASGESRPTEAIDDFCRILEAGINVVTTSVPGLLYPSGFDSTHVARIDAACRRGESSLYASGIEPGFAGDHLVLTLTTMSKRIRSIRTQEIFGYEHYPVAFTMFEVFGFGKPIDHRCLMELPGVQTSAWGPPVQLVADQLGVALSEIRETYEKRATDRTLEVAAGTIDAGTVGAVRFETIGVVDGRDAIVIEHINRMAPDLAPDWPTAERDGTYRITIDGEPGLTCELQLGTPASFSLDGMLATTMRVVNAIPFVCDAPPGIVTSTGLPLTLPRHAFGERNSETLGTG
jgi:2,4-diaminopentanoate dehydrogenase